MRPIVAHPQQSSLHLSYFLNPNLRNTLTKQEQQLPSNISLQELNKTNERKTIEFGN